MGIESFLEIEILEALMKGKRTVAELIQELYETSRDNSEYSAYYDRGSASKLPGHTKANSKEN